jgi:hypothetical protein
MFIWLRSLSSSLSSFSFLRSYSSRSLFSLSSFSCLSFSSRSFCSFSAFSFSSRSFFSFMDSILLAPNPAKPVDPPPAPDGFAQLGPPPDAGAGGAGFTVAALRFHGLSPAEESVAPVLAAPGVFIHDGPDEGTDGGAGGGFVAPGVLVAPPICFFQGLSATLPPPPICFFQGLSSILL